jgi:Domain of unknown function (DUF4329)
MANKHLPDGEKEAARAALRSVNEQSKREDREYGIWIYLQARTYHAGEPFTSDLVDGLSESDLLRELAKVPKGAKRVAFAHTHGAASEGYLSTHFSPEDIEFGQHFSVNLYLATPSDQLVTFRLSDKPGDFRYEKL